MNRTRIRSRSRRRAAAGPARTTIREAVFARDRCCQLAGSTFGPCFGPLTVHHLWKEGQGGPYVPINLLTLCAHHNDVLETSEVTDDDVVALGLKVGWGQTLVSAWRRLVFAGIVGHWWDGTPADDPEPVDELELTR